MEVQPIGSRYTGRKEARVARSTRPASLPSSPEKPGCQSGRMKRRRRAITVSGSSMCEKVPLRSIQ